jgi:hypothetical protein
VTRHYTGLESFGIAVAATMIDGHVRREAVSACMNALVKWPATATVKDSPLFRAYNASDDTNLLISGDEVCSSPNKRPRKSLRQRMASVVER